MSIVRTIIEQVGRGTFFMLGTKDDVVSCAEGRGIHFAVRGSPKKINRVEIVLAGDDTYTVSFHKIRYASARYGYERKTIAEFEGIYADGLHDIIEKYTGLVTRMPRIIRGTPA